MIEDGHFDITINDPDPSTKREPYQGGPLDSVQQYERDILFEVAGTYTNINDPDSLHAYAAKVLSQYPSLNEDLHILFTSLDEARVNALPEENAALLEKIMFRYKSLVESEDGSVQERHIEAYEERTKEVNPSLSGNLERNFRILNEWSKVVAQSTLGSSLVNTSLVEEIRAAGEPRQNRVGNRILPHYLRIVK